MLVSGHLVTRWHVTVRVNLLWSAVVSCKSQLCRLPCSLLHFTVIYYDLLKKLVCDSLSAFSYCIAHNEGMSLSYERYQCLECKFGSQQRYARVFANSSEAALCHLYFSRVEFGR